VIRRIAERRYHAETLALRAECIERATVALAPRPA
jgi:hypothetical protein